MLNAWTDGKLGPQNQQWPPQLIVTKSKWKHLENTERTRGINVDQICIDQNLLFIYTVHAFRSFLVLSTWTSLNFVYGGCLLFPMFLFPPIFRKLEKNTQQFVTGQETDTVSSRSWLTQHCVCCFNKCMTLSQNLHQWFSFQFNHYFLFNTHFL